MFNSKQPTNFGSESKLVELLKSIEEYVLELTNPELLMSIEEYELESEQQSDMCEPKLREELAKTSKPLREWRAPTTYASQ